MEGQGEILSKEYLEKVISECLFNQPEPESMTISLYTGRGGTKEFIKAWCKEIGVEYNWKNFRRWYTYFRKTGQIRVYRWNNKKN